MSSRLHCESCHVFQLFFHEIMPGCPTACGGGGMASLLGGLGDRFPQHNR